MKVKLQEQPFQVLAALVERPGEVVSREELQKRLWPEGTFVDFERGLNKAINRVREALEDDAENPRFIETLPQRGYRFLAPVETATAEIAVEPAPQPAPSLPRRRGVLALAGGLAATLAVPGYYLLRTPVRRIESIAVLPLENLSDDPTQEYFSDGMTDELIGELAHIRSLRVVSRTSVMQYKKGGRRKSLPEIARELNVDAILEGTVLQSGGKVRITAQLIRAQDDRHLWSEKYERNLTEVLALQSEVAREVAREIQVTLTPQEAESLKRKRVAAPESYQALLRGNFFLYRGIPGIQKSIDLFREAIRLDPLHAEAHAGLAQALCFAGIFGFRPPIELFPAAQTAALKALELDDSNAAAHNVLAEVKKDYAWDFAGAVKEYHRAIELNPSHLLSHWWYAECLSRMKRYDEALAESARALTLDPVAPGSLVLRSMLLHRAHHFDESIRTSQQALELDANAVNALWWQGLSYAAKRDFPAAIACFTRALAINDVPVFRSLLGYAYALAGEKAKALGTLERLSAMAKQRYVSPVDFAVVHAGLGDANAAFQWMEKAYQTRATRVQEISSIYFDGFRGDPRYDDLRKRVGLPA
ncbi:MAG: winged helix-turn-helix domain-containing protein [Acidobacteriota bacterium]